MKNRMNNSLNISDFFLANYFGSLKNLLPWEEGIIERDVQ